MTHNLHLQTNECKSGIHGMGSDRKGKCIKKGEGTEGGEGKDGMRQIMHDMH